MNQCFHVGSVSVAPGGRWNRFKTYSTIQRTLEIWVFVLTFIFKDWLNNHKFSYRGFHLHMAFKALVMVFSIMFVGIHGK
ncbi:unnamed protein product [Ilex paraguariensis]|uniref:Uncharacterized protein n=1 Tax=Ilex paraguariensis TaxID=185542 RepID=A0ABC8U8V5_9AQUA